MLLVEGNNIVYALAPNDARGRGFRHAAVNSQTLFKAEYRIQHTAAASAHEQKNNETEREIIMQHLSLYFIMKVAGKKYSYSLRSPSACACLRAKNYNITHLPGVSGAVALDDAVPPVRGHVVDYLLQEEERWEREKRAVKQHRKTNRNGLCNMFVTKQYQVDENLVSCHRLIMAFTRTRNLSAAHIHAQNANHERDTVHKHDAKG